MDANPLTNPARCRAGDGVIPKSEIRNFFNLNLILILIPTTPYLLTPIY